MPARRGVLVFVLLVVVVGVAVLVGTWRVRQPSVASDASTVLVFDVPATLEETEPPAGGFPFARSRRDRATLYDVVEGLHRAADDDRVEALAMHVDGLDWGWARIAEVRDAVLAFRAAGKPVYASLTGGGEREYLLASAADVVSMPPMSNLQLDGLSATAIFFRGAFDKLDVHPNFAHVGRFKSGVEPFTRTGMSEDSRAALDAVVGDLYDQFADSVAAARGLTPDAVRALIDDGPWVAERAVKAGLLDTLLYDADVDSLASRDGARRRPTLSFARYRARASAARAGTRVALVVASGEIVPGRSRALPGEGVVLGAETLVDALREARTRRSIKAVVLRIDSPGGVATASDDLWREVDRCRAAKPVIVSMSDYAASGGYYMAVGADSIVAQPSTITGSIGIFGGKLNVLGLYQKLGLNVETVSRGRNAQMLSPYRDFSEEESRRFRESLEHFYRGFVARVARGRHLSPAVVDSIAQGRVWSGADAMAVGLVDRLGGLDVAMGMARAQAKIPADEPLVVERFPRVQHTFFDRMLEQLVHEGDDDEALAWLSGSAAFRAWSLAAQFPEGVALARLPYRLDIR